MEDAYDSAGLHIQGCHFSPQAELTLIQTYTCTTKVLLYSTPLLASNVFQLLQEILQEIYLTLKGRALSPVKDPTNSLFRRSWTCMPLASIENTQWTIPTVWRTPIDDWDLLSWEAPIDKTPCLERPQSRPLRPYRQTSCFWKASTEYIPRPSIACSEGPQWKRALA